MRYIKIIILIVFMSSCSNGNRIKTFENILGRDNDKSLKLVVSDFENIFLKNEYPNLSIEGAYKAFLIDVINEKDGLENRLDRSKQRFENSNLKFDIYSYVDSVWIEKEEKLIYLKYKYLNSKGVFSFRESQVSYNHDKESKEHLLIDYYKTWVDINYNGKYWIALKAISSEDPFINHYMKMTNSVGLIQPNILAKEMLSRDLNYSDYFIKRIIATMIIPKSFPNKKK
ncbi:hypothetical protein [Pseudofulvibacter geojedonensis]|uniref:Lipoprotein n=1 Tax=Pseudofulvibacter geojedonensis TaxID=1123758 RepID=A0ABW3I047_9FLAO